MVRGPSAEATHTTCPAHYAESAPLFPRGLFLRGAQSAEAGSAGGTAYRHSAALRMPVASTRGGSAPAAPRPQGRLATPAFVLVAETWAGVATGI